MSSKWPWSTEWNGIFMPVEDAAVMTFATLLFSLVGYLFYLLFKLAAEGLRALRRGELDRAMLYWFGAALPFLLIGSVVFSRASSAAAQERAWQAQQGAYESAVQEKLAAERASLSSLVVVGNVVSRHVEANYTDVPFISFTITNNSEYRVLTELVNPPEGLYCLLFWGSGRDVIDEGEAREYDCEDHTSSGVQEVCFRFEELQAYAFGEEVTHDSCYEVVYD